MKAAGLLVDQTGTTRRPWRLVVFILSTAAAYAILQAVVYPFIGAASSAAGVSIAVYSWLMLGALLLGHRFTFATVEPRSWAMVGLDRSAAHPRTLAAGFLLGALAIGIPSLLLVAIGWLQLRPEADGSSLAAAASHLVTLAPAALAEEMLTRGYVFAILREAWGAPAALVVTSVAFGVLHLANEGATVLSLTLVTLAGVYLAAILIVTRSLYAAWTAHLGWNWVLAGVLHTAVSGIPFHSPDYRVVDAGPDWATGGVWGPEGGAAAGLGMLAGLSYLYARRRRREER